MGDENWVMSDHFFKPNKAQNKKKIAISYIYLTSYLNFHVLGPQSKAARVAYKLFGELVVSQRERRRRRKLQSFVSTLPPIKILTYWASHLMAAPVFH